MRSLRYLNGGTPSPFPASTRTRTGNRPLWTFGIQLRILLSVRASLLLLATVLVACRPSTAPTAQQPRDPGPERYSQNLADLTQLNRTAKSLVQQGKLDQASALIVKGEALSSRLLSVRNPSLATLEAASDLDELYGQMLLANRNYGWARLLFQKNLARWKHWKPQTPETLSRLNQAQSAIAECDRRMSQ